MQEMMLYSAQESVYSTASEHLRKYFGLQADPKQLERLVHAYGEEVKGEINHAEDSQLPSEKEAGRYYVMMDGSMILTRKEGWKEVKLARIFAASDHLPENEHRSYIRDSFYLGHLGSHREFLRRLEPTVDRLKDPVFVNDGAKWIWAWVDQFYPNATLILDFYHAAEHLSGFSKDFFLNPEVAQKWIEENKQKLLSDGVEELIEEVSALLPPNPAAQKAQKSLLQYYRSNKHRMKYKTFRDKGLMIGSGPIESAHRTVIQARLKKSGQRWSIDGANAVIQIRAAKLSGKWELVIKAIQNAA